MTIYRRHANITFADVFISRIHRLHRSANLYCAHRHDGAHSHATHWGGLPFRFDWFQTLKVSCSGFSQRSFRNKKSLCSSVGKPSRWKWVTVCKSHYILFNQPRRSRIKKTCCFLSSCTFPRNYLLNDKIRPQQPCCNNGISNGSIENSRWVSHE